MANVRLTDQKAAHKTADDAGGAKRQQSALKSTLAQESGLHALQCLRGCRDKGIQQGGQV